MGEPGTGKSTALRRYVTGLNPALYKPCYFALSTFSVLEFYHGLALEAGGRAKAQEASRLSPDSAGHLLP